MASISAQSISASTSTASVSVSVSNVSKSIAPSSAPCKDMEALSMQELIQQGGYKRERGNLRDLFQHFDTLHPELPIFVDSAIKVLSDEMRDRTDCYDAFGDVLCKASVGEGNSGQGSDYETQDEKDLKQAKAMRNGPLHAFVHLSSVSDDTDEQRADHMAHAFLRDPIVALMLFAYDMDDIVTYPRILSFLLSTDEKFNFESWSVVAQRLVGFCFNEESKKEQWQGPDLTKINPETIINWIDESDIKERLLTYTLPFDIRNAYRMTSGKLKKAKTTNIEEIDRTNSFVRPFEQGNTHMTLQRIHSLKNETYGYILEHASGLALQEYLKMRANRFWSALARTGYHTATKTPNCVLAWKSKEFFDAMVQFIPLLRLVRTFSYLDGKHTPLEESKSYLEAYETCKDAYDTAFFFGPGLWRNERVSTSASERIATATVLEGKERKESASTSACTSASVSAQTCSNTSSRKRRHTDDNNEEDEKNKKMREEQQLMQEAEVEIPASPVMPVLTSPATSTAVVASASSDQVVPPTPQQSALRSPPPLLRLGARANSSHLPCARRLVFSQEPEKEFKEVEDRFPSHL